MRPSSLPAPSRKARQGFTLVEILAVITIIALALALGTFSVKNTMRSVDLSASATTLSDTLNLARQTALSSNRPVEVRFYKVPPKDQPVSAPPGSFVYRAVALYTAGDNGPVQTGKLAYLHGNVQLADTQTFGPLLYFNPTAQGPLRSLDPSGSVKFDYRYFFFHSDGSTSLDSQTPNADSWHSMLYDPQQPPTAGQPPANYITVQVDPATGRSETFQP